jgi:type I restriction-modification system DNA methylase subunit
MGQLDLFQKDPLSEETFDYAKGEVKEPSQEEIKTAPWYDKTMALLEKWNKEVEKQNLELRAMIDELQADWTEDEKLQVNDPKEWQRRQKEKEKELKEQPAMKLSSDVIESLKRCRIEGNTLFLPPISEGPLENYQQVRQALINAGATYKKNTFVFKSDAQPFIDRLTTGESVNIKKEFQFFPTPDDIADYLVSLADLQESDRILEPSAGQGAIINAILRHNEHAIIECCELMPENADVLIKAGYKVIRNDFMQITDRKSAYDKIIANPPFSKNQDIDHIMKMWECLKPGGRIVSIASKHWQHSNNKKEKQFRDWLKNSGAELHPIERGQFKESGTMVETCIVVINK